MRRCTLQNNYSLLRAALILLLTWSAGCHRQTTEPAKSVEAEAQAPSRSPKPFVPITGAKGGVWTQDLEGARTLARKDGLPILLYFCASDWSESCRILNSALLSVGTVPETVIPVLIDFPMNKKLLPEVVQRRNEEVQERYRVNGYPMFILLGSQGNEELARFTLTGDGGARQLQERLHGLFSERSNTVINLQGTKLQAATGKGESVEYLMKGSQPGRWTQDLDAAKTEASSTNRPILMMFMGPDWSRSGKTIDEQVLSLANWQRFARKNLVLVAIDQSFDSELPTEIRRRNDALAKQFKIAYYPTFLLMTTDGKNLVGEVANALSPREFKRNVREVLRFSPARIDAVAKYLSSERAGEYRRSIETLVKAWRRGRELSKRSEELEAIEGITAAFRDEVRQNREIFHAFDMQVRTYEAESFASQLPDAMAERYRKLQAELNAAEKVREDWLREHPEPTADNLRTLKDYQLTIDIVQDAIGDVQRQHAATKLTEERAGRYLSIYGQLQASRQERKQWLEGNPSDSAENRTVDEAMLREIHDLEDRLDAISGD